MTPELQTQYNRLKARLRIDEFDMDRELMEQGALVQDASELANELRETASELKHAYDIIKAEASMRIRRATEKPPTDTTVATLVILEKDVQDARAQTERAELDAALAAALAGAFHDRRYMLTKRSDLIVCGFITPSSSYREAREAMAGQRERTIPVRRATDGR
jgi:hypothetical protein